MNVVSGAFELLGQLLSLLFRVPKLHTQQ
jgi:hypothetical protein